MIQDFVIEIFDSLVARLNVDSLTDKLGCALASLATANIDLVVLLLVLDGCEPSIFFVFVQEN